MASDFAKLAPVKALTKDQPKVVAHFIERLVECHHFGGEDNYSKERAAQIQKASDTARCMQLDADELILLKKYKKNRSVKAAIEKAKKLAL